MKLQNTFFSFLDEIKKSIQEKTISSDLHNTFVLFVYTLYNFILSYILILYSKLYTFIFTYLPLPSIHS
jgi:hypothetical protein